jgi:hypothetical protein
MERTNFEKLQVYQLSEKIADSIWNIVVSWDSLAKDTVGKQIVRAADSVGANIAEEVVEEAFKTIGVLSGWREALCTRRFIGCGART